MPRENIVDVREVIQAMRLKKLKRKREAPKDGSKLVCPCKKRKAGNGLWLIPILLLRRRRLRQRIKCRRNPHWNGRDMMAFLWKGTVSSRNVRGGCFVMNARTLNTGWLKWLQESGKDEGILYCPSCCCAADNPPCSHLKGHSLLTNQSPGQSCHQIYFQKWRMEDQRKQKIYIGYLGWYSVNFQGWKLLRVLIRIAVNLKHGSDI